MHGLRLCRLPTSLPFKSPDLNTTILYEYSYVHTYVQKSLLLFALCVRATNTDRALFASSVRATKTDRAKSLFTFCIVRSCDANERTVYVNERTMQEVKWLFASSVRVRGAGSSRESVRTDGSKTSVTWDFWDFLWDGSLGIFF